MKVHDIATKTFETKDDLVVDLAEAINEVDELVKAHEECVSKLAEKESEVASLKEKNLLLLSMIPTVKEESKNETEKENETIDENEILI